jgi:hypothetical protein
MIGDHTDELVVVTKILPAWLEKLKMSYNQNAWSEDTLNKVQDEGRIYVDTNMNWRGKIITALYNSSVVGHSRILSTKEDVLLAKIEGNNTTSCAII